jgi:hypothetical protein
MDERVVINDDNDLNYEKERYAMKKCIRTDNNPSILCFNHAGEPERRDFFEEQFEYCR